MSVLQEFRLAISAQQQKQDEAYDEQISLPIGERVSKGVTMTNLRVEFRFHDSPPNPWCPHLDHPFKFIKSALIFTSNNISKFRVGDQVVLSHGRYAFRLEVIEDSLSRFILAPNDFEVKNCFLNSEQYYPNGWEINVIKTDLTQKLLSATAGSLENDPVRLGKIEKLLAGTLSNPITKDVRYDRLNDPQNNAVAKAINSHNFHLIQGPPGTGKTKTIAHLARYFLDQGKKVFITAPTHTAINNCLNAVASEVLDRSKIVKIGEKHQATEIIKNDYITRLTHLPLDRYINSSDLSKGGIAIGATAYSLCYPASKRLNNWEFDIALIDEAAQMSIPLAVAVMSKTDKYIFVGDHNQLDPVIPSGTGVNMLKKSVFKTLEGLYSRDVSVLTISYRLNEGLIRIPNRLFYQDRLTSDRSLDQAIPQINSAKYSEVFENEDPKILYLHQEFDSQGRSPYEARIVAEMVNDIIGNGVSLRDIGILTPYRAQVREIKKALNEIVGGIETEQTDSLFIDTVDRMQGQERDYIVYSMSNSHPLESKRRLDFFYSPNRLNVAITRAKVKCIVIANYKVFDIIDEELKELPEYPKLRPRLDVFKEYYRLSTKVQEEVGEDDW